MSWIDIDDSVLWVHFTPWEKLLGMVHDVQVPLDVITSVEQVRSWTEIDGPHRGWAVRGLWYLGRWTSGHGRILVSVRRDVPSVRITAPGQPYPELIVSTHHPQLVGGSLPRRATPVHRPRGVT